MQRSIELRVAAWVALLLAGGIAHAVLWHISEPAGLFDDFHKAYYPTADLLWREGPQPTWFVDDDSELGFVNIPVVAWLFVPLALLDEDTAAWVFLGFGYAASVAAWALLVRLGRPDAKMGPTLLFFFLVNGPLVYSLREGNITHFVLLLLVVALVLWNERSEYAAGLVLGACAVLKLPLLLYGVYFLLRRRWKVVAGGATTIAFTVALSFLIFGIDINVGWYQNCIAPFLGRVVPAFNVQSIDGFLMRLSTGSEYLRYWQPVLPTILHRAVRLLMFAGVLCGIFLLLWRANDGKRPAGGAGALAALYILEYVMILNLSLVLSPLSWTHYYLLLLLPWGLYLGGRLALPEGACDRSLIWTGILLSSLPVVVVSSESDWAWFLSRSAVSAWLFGGLCMLATVLHAHWRIAKHHLAATC
jgi:Glycosyltransferase family 87